MKPEDFIHMPIPASMFTAVCALLGGSTATKTAPAYIPNVGDRPETVPVVGYADASAVEASNDVAEASPPASDPNDVDAGGWPWSPDMHASTKGKTKDGYWRMKVGVTRPANKPGFDAGSTSTESTGETVSTPSEDAPTPAATSTVEEDDEFAAFRAASEKVDAAGEAAAAAIPARQWTDADLGALCNQAAVKLGDPTPVKALIAEYVPDGEVAHSRNIPADKRAEFVVAVEAKAGIQFAG